MDTVFELHGVRKSFRGRPLFEEVNLSLEQETCVAVQGPNGSGKSVLFKIICGFVRPDAGLVQVNPRYLAPGRTFPQGFGILIDRPGYLPDRTGRENLQALASIRKVIGDAEIDAALAAVDLDPGLTQRVAHYSLGMKQKLALAQAFMEGQQVLLLDEPFNGLDADSSERIALLLESFVAAGRTLLFTSHHQADVDRLAHHRYAINGYRLLELPAT